MSSPDGLGASAVTYNARYTLIILLLKQSIIVANAFHFLSRKRGQCTK